MLARRGGASRSGRGAGGDVTMAIDRVAEDVVSRSSSRSGGRCASSARRSASVELGGGGPVVVVDPIDGSLNAKRGLPVFATSIALADGPSDGRRHPRPASATTAPARSGSPSAAAGRRSTARRSTPLDRATRPSTCCWSRAPIPAASGRVAVALDGRVGRFRALGSLALSLCHAGRRPLRRDGRAWARARSVDVAAAQLVPARRAAVGLPARRRPPRDPPPPDARFHVLGRPRRRDDGPARRASQSPRDAQREERRADREPRLRAAEAW